MRRTIGNRSAPAAQRRLTRGRYRQGATLVEAQVALVVMTIASTGIVTLVAAASGVVDRVRHRAMAMEAARSAVPPFEIASCLGMPMAATGQIGHRLWYRIHGATVPNGGVGTVEAGWSVPPSGPTVESIRWEVAFWCG